MTILPESWQAVLPKAVQHDSVYVAPRSHQLLDSLTSRHGILAELLKIAGTAAPARLATTPATAKATTSAPAASPAAAAPPAMATYTQVI